MLSKILCLLWACLPALLMAQNVQKLSQEAQKAYKDKDYKRFLEIYQTLDSVRPMHPTVLYNLSAGYALNKEGKKAIETLEKLILINASTAVAKDSDFVSLWQTHDFQRVVKKIDDIRQPVQNSQEAFRIAQKDLHIESVGYDAQTQTFYCGSIHKRKIVQIDSKGNVSDFTKEGQASIWAVLGLQVDAEKRVLWAVTTAMPEMEGFEPAQEGKSKVLKFDLTTRQLLAEYAIDDANTHFFGDLILHPDGTVYVSDSGYPAIYQIKPTENKLTFFTKTSLRSLQGLALNKKGNKMFVADYANQLYVIDLPTLTVTALSLPAGVSAKGTDGLYFWNNTLVAIQNGVSPKRVVQFSLNKAQTQITAFKVIEANNPLFDEPTLGVLVGDMLYYVANSSWNAYKEGVLITDNLGDIVVLKTLLKR
jgi:sugar lactone lactonase YvrE